MKYKIGDYLGYEYASGDWLYIQVIDYINDKYKVRIVKDMDTHRPKWAKGEIHTVGIPHSSQFIKLDEREILFEVL